MILSCSFVRILYFKNLKFIQAQEACSSMEIDSALEQLDNLAQDLDDIKTAALAGKLQPLPGENVRNDSLISSTISILKMFREKVVQVFVSFTNM